MPVKIRKNYLRRVGRSKYDAKGELYGDGNPKPSMTQILHIRSVGAISRDMQRLNDQRSRRSAFVKNDIDTGPGIYQARRNPKGYKSRMKNRRIMAKKSQKANRG